MCPTLLSIACSICGKKGHTPKYCKDNIEKEKKTVEFVNVAPKKTLLKTKSLFSIMHELKLVDSDEDESKESYNQVDDKFDVSDIIWGVGLKSMRGKKWADFC